MTRFLADENFNNQIVRGILRQAPSIDIVRVQDVGLSGVDDPTVLAWAAETGIVSIQLVSPARGVRIHNY